MGLDCLLVSANTTTIPYPVYPLALGHLAGALKARGHRPILFDMLTHGGLEGLSRVLAQKAVDVTALSLRNVDTVDSSNQEVYVEDYLEVVRVIRDSTRVPVVLGGPAFSIFPSHFMELLGADYGIVGAGERLLPDLLDLLEHGGRPPKKLMRAEPEDQEWQPISHDRTAASYYMKCGGMLNVQTKRGCPYRCAYCSYPEIEGRRIRSRNPQEAADEMERLARDFGARYLFVTDAVFNDQEGRYLELAEELVRRELGLSWCAYFRPKGIGREELELLKRAGLAAMEVGTDAGTDETLEAMNKPFTFDDVMAFHHLAETVGIPAAHFVIFGGPGETMSSFRQGLRNMERLGRDVVFGFLGIRILPNTPIHATAVSEGIISQDEDLLYPRYYFSPEVDRVQMEQELKQQWASRMDRIFPVSELYSRLSYLHNSGYVGPMWDLLSR